MAIERLRLVQNRVNGYYVAIFRLFQMMKPLYTKAAQDYAPLPLRKKLLDKWPETPDEIQRGMGKSRLPGALKFEPKAP